MLWQQRLGRRRLPVDHHHPHRSLLLLREWELGRLRLRLWLQQQRLRLLSQTGT